MDLITERNRKRLEQIGADLSVYESANTSTNLTFSAPVEENSEELRENARGVFASGRAIGGAVGRTSLGSGVAYGPLGEPKETQKTEHFSAALYAAGLSLSVATSDRISETDKALIIERMIDLAVDVTTPRERTE